MMTTAAVQGSGIRPRQFQMSACTYPTCKLERHFLHTSCLHVVCGLALGKTFGSLWARCPTMIPSMLPVHPLSRAPLTNGDSVHATSASTAPLPNDGSVHDARIQFSRASFTCRRTFCCRGEPQKMPRCVFSSSFCTLSQCKSSHSTLHSTCEA